MSTSIKFSGLALLLACLLSPLSGIWASFVIGGEEGATNLPAAYTPSCGGGQIAYARRGLRSTDDIMCRVKVEVPTLDNGLALTLPSNMPSAVATFGRGGLRLPSCVVDDVLRFDSNSLRALQASTVEELAVTLADGVGSYLRILIVFDGAGCEIYVE